MKIDSEIARQIDREIDRENQWVLKMRPLVRSGKCPAVVELTASRTGPGYRARVCPQGQLGSLPPVWEGDRWDLPNWAARLPKVVVA